MMNVLALLASTAFLAPMELTPTDDVWVYPHASDAVSDPFLRTWGMGVSMPGSGDDEQNFSYSYLRFDLSGVSAMPIAKATLVLTHIAKPSFTAENIKGMPIEVRKMNGTFDEKKWTYDMLSKVRPVAGKENVFGDLTPSAFPAEEPFKLEIDLMKGPGKFRDAFSAAKSAGFLNLALTSPIDPSELGNRAMYKVYSRNAEEKFRPKLVLTFVEMSRTLKQP